MNKDKKLTLEEKKINLIKKSAIAIVAVVFFLIIFFGSWYTIPAGERGIVLTFQKPNMIPTSEGLHFKIPLIQHVVKMDIKTQKYTIEKAAAASKDLQTVTTDITLNYFISPESVPQIFTTIGINYQDKIITPAVLEVVKAQTAGYTAEELITKRPEVKDKIDVALKDRLRIFNIIVQAISITNFDFSPEFNKAIETKVTAEQNALAEKNNLAKVQYQAQQRISQAEGEAKAIQIQVEAINKQGGASYVELQRIAKWNGNLPSVVGGSSIVDMRTLVGFSGFSSTTQYSSQGNQSQ